MITHSAWECRDELGTGPKQGRIQIIFLDFWTDYASISRVYKWPVCTWIVKFMIKVTAVKFNLQVWSHSPGSLCTFNCHCWVTQQVAVQCLVQNIFNHHLGLISYDQVLLSSILWSLAPARRRSYSHRMWDSVPVPLTDYTDSLTVGSKKALESTRPKPSRPKTNSTGRPKTKSAQNQLGPKLTRPWITRSFSSPLWVWRLVRESNPRFPYKSTVNIILMNSSVHMLKQSKNS